MKLFALGIVTIILLVCNIFFGAVSFPASEILDVITGQRPDDDILRAIIIEGRLPQALTALMAGAALAASGLMLQTVFRNPLAGPSILGITSGASLGVALVLLLSGGVISIGAQNLGGNLAIMVGAVIGSFAVMALLLALSARLRNNLTLLITGMMTGYLTSSLVSLLSSVSEAGNIQSFVMWGMGTFANVGLSRLPIFATLIIIGLLMSMLLCKPLNLLLLGINYATNLGVNVHRVRQMLLVSTGLLSAIVTACCGPIGFIGLAMPHIARLLIRTDDHLKLMPATMLCGSILALLCNLVSVMPEGKVIPINALTPLAGVPVVLYVILFNRGNASE